MIGNNGQNISKIPLNRQIFDRRALSGCLTDLCDNAIIDAMLSTNGEGHVYIFSGRWFIEKWKPSTAIMEENKKLINDFIPNSNGRQQIPYYIDAAFLDKSSSTFYIFKV